MFFVNKLPNLLNDEKPTDFVRVTTFYSNC